MKVILKSDVKKVGRKGEVVEVADGYARNFLIARGLAVATTAKSLEILAEQKEQEHEEEMKRKAEAEALAEKLNGMKFQFLVNANDDGRVFGSVSTKQIVEELARQGIRIDKRKILDTDPIVSLGVTKVRVELYKGVIGIVNCVLKGK
ncbi:MAG: 50S ribosomal protein L9 [Solobacterium sp.]|nr:50S ribosomal protein L9 [Solobacterium sp.]MBR0213364.1 50S ribosomal protein L9 [Solobacterium sp.]